MTYDLKKIIGFVLVIFCAAVFVSEKDVRLSLAADTSSTSVKIVSDCGNGVLDTGEECDDGGLCTGDDATDCISDADCSSSGGVCQARSNDGCDDFCVWENVCGNGVIEMPEECDNGGLCTGDNQTYCISDADCFSIGGVCTVRNGDGCDSNCLTEASAPPPPPEVTISTITVTPEQRSGVSGTNNDTKFNLYVLDNQSGQIMYQSSAPLSADNTGKFYGPIVLSGFSAGLYDIVVKSNAHLSAKLDNHYLVKGDNNLVFSTPLLAGDLNTGSVYGDDVINSVDLSVLILKLNTSDPSGNNIRSNLNQDTIVNTADLNILLGNLDKRGTF